MGSRQECLEESFQAMSGLQYCWFIPGAESEGTLKRNDVAQETTMHRACSLPPPFPQQLPLLAAAASLLVSLGSNYPETGAVSTMV